jgi:hypothetical protein
VCWGHRNLYNNGVTGTLPSELGILTALTSLCVRHPHPTAPARLRRHQVVWAERGGGVRVAGCYNKTVSRGRCPPSWAPWTRCNTCACAALTPPRLHACAVTRLCGLSAAAA